MSKERPPDEIETVLLCDAVSMSDPEPIAESDVPEQEGECPVCYAMGPVYQECTGTEDEPHEPAEFLP